MLKGCYLLYMNLDNIPSLYSLPTEMQVQIFSYLKPDDRVSVSRACKIFKEIIFFPPMCGDIVSGWSRNLSYSKLSSALELYGPYVRKLDVDPAFKGVEFLNIFSKIETNCPRLQVLIASDNEAINHLLNSSSIMSTPLERLTLSLWQRPSLTEIARPFSHLKILELDRCISINLIFIEKVQSLSFLILSGCQNVTFPEELVLPLLEKFKCYYSEFNETETEELSAFIKRHTHLRNLDFQTSKTENFDFLRSLTSLTRLNLHLSNFDDVYDLPCSTSLKKLYLGHCKMTSLEGLDKVSLQELDLSDTLIKNFPELSSQSTLRSLSITVNSDENIQAIQCLTDLENLNVSFDLKRFNVSFVNGFQKLRKLHVQYLSSPLPTLIGLDVLSDVSFSHCPTLFDLKILSNITQLSSISVHSCRNFCSLKNLKFLVKPIHLHFDSVNYLTGVETLLRYTSLRTLTLEVRELKTRASNKEFFSQLREKNPFLNIELIDDNDY